MKATGDYDLNRAAELKNGTLMSLQCQLEEAEKIFFFSDYQGFGISLVLEEVSDLDIAEVVSKWTGIIVKPTEVREGQTSSLEQFLHKCIVGQDVAVKSVADSIRRLGLDFLTITDL